MGFHPTHIALEEIRRVGSPTLFFVGISRGESEKACPFSYYKYDKLPSFQDEVFNDIVL